MRRQKKIAALVMLLIYTASTFYPGVAVALTNGPSQPESTQFQAVTITNLVDPFTGDFSYNIPLLDVDGYPLNLAYNAGASMDEESSWVGYGWNVNPGSVSRIMKGIPDDFDGTDIIHKSYNIRPDVTGGVAFNISAEIFGLDFLGANASCDIFYNNQRGLGVEIGAGISATLSVSKHSAGEYTGGLTAGGNLGITSNSQTGADFNFGANMGISTKDKENNTGSLGFKLGGGLNSRAGLKSTTLGVSFNTSKQESKKSQDDRKAKMNDKQLKHFKPLSHSGSMSLGSTISSYGQAFNPTITMPMQSQSYSLSPMAGLEFWGFNTPTIQLTGHYSKQSLAISEKDFPAYGFIHSDLGRTNPLAILDFNREKDVPYMESTPTLAVPFITQDLFTATSQFGSSQFKAFSNSSGVFFDTYASNKSLALSLGVEFGIGGGLKAGADLSGSGSSTVTRKWTMHNDFLYNGDFSTANKDPYANENPSAYFKLVGEKSSINKDFLNQIAGLDPVKVKTGEVTNNAQAYSTLASNNREYSISSAIARNIREPRGEIFSVLTGKQASKFALDKTINSYSSASSTTLNCINGFFGTSNPTTIDRTGDNHKSNHFSEITVTKNDGMRLVYGVPVYNNSQTDVTFSVDKNDFVSSNNLVTYLTGENTKDNTSGIDHYFSKENVPAYATSFLLSGVCSPDYVDVTGDGISDDDLGTAVKFNYTRANDKYQWRTPSGTGTNYANFNKGLIKQDDDNKASYSFGTKELWYTHSIESKNMIAVFRTSPRNDALGYYEDGAIDNDSKQMKLDQIDLYTKAELIKSIKDNTTPIPIKSVHFEYDYSLFPNVPNHVPSNDPLGTGKLTLRSVYFTYANNTGGDDNRYYFKYNQNQDNSAITNDGFQYQQYDRWGNYKDKNGNIVPLDNNDFPYSVQDKQQADDASKKWQLSEIELPSGGKIKVEYESDDYAFVQDRRAMQMAKIVGYGQFHNFSNFQLSDKVYIELPQKTLSKDVKWQYFEGVDQLYFKSMLDLDDNNNNEFVSGYAKINEVKLFDPNSSATISTDDIITESNIVEVTLQKRGDYHPIVAAAWQFMRQSLPKLAFPYHVDETLGPLAFVQALIAAIRNVGELMTPFESRAMRLHFASEMSDQAQNVGYVRILNSAKINLDKNSPDYNESKMRKYGGGYRVKKIIMDDNWGNMAGANNGTTTTTGMSFDYTKKYITPDGSEINISSGVASYEPMSGAEENPFKQPIAYQQQAHLNTNIYTVEEPLGESYLPSPSVGYSQVKIINLDAEGKEVSNGYTVKKFYTARDFPSIVNRTDLSKKKYNQTSIFGLFNIGQGNSVVLSQGFLVENNDMHGQPMSEETFDGTGKMLSGTYYHYKSSGTEHQMVDNHALTLQQDGTIKDDIIGEEFEMFHDMREQVTDNTGVNINVNLDVLYFFIAAIPIPTYIPIVQSTYCGYQSASTIKIIHHYAIPDKITTIENGSTMTSENMLWDAVTGQVLLTKTQNAFDDPLYNFTLPAYMVTDYEKGMGGAYKNEGILFKAKVTDGLSAPNINSYLVEGDELGFTNAGEQEKLWVMNTPSGLRLIKRDGTLFSSNNSLDGDLVLLRSGRRNLINSSTYSVVSLKSPIRNGKIDIDQSSEILNSSANSFSDKWSADIKRVMTCIKFSPSKKPVTPNKPGDDRCQCSIPQDQIVNPYVVGLLGNWHGNKGYVYTTDRTARPDLLNSATLPTDIRKGGIFTDFNSFYIPGSGGFNAVPTSNWIAPSTVTIVNGKGQELENVDALGKYSAAQFGFNDLIATAVASNSRSHEIGYDGFEDYGLDIGCANDIYNYCNGHFDFKKILVDAPAKCQLSSQDAHTGNYSFKVEKGYKGAKSFYPFMITSGQKYGFINNEMVLNKAGLIPRFEPLTDKTYILTAWIKTDGEVVTSNDDPDDPNKAKIILDGSENYFGTPSCGIYHKVAVKSSPKVEGWTRVSLIFSVPLSSLCPNQDHRLGITLFPGSENAYFDDIRIYPYDGNMKSFAYDFRTSRLMAELDENNYATYYEYSDEGQLLRVKKETEKGIITLKETRSKVRKNKRS